MSDIAYGAVIVVAILVAAASTIALLRGLSRWRRGEDARLTIRR